MLRAVVHYNKSYCSPERRLLLTGGVGGGFGEKRRMLPDEAESIIMLTLSMQTIFVDLAEILHA